MRADVHQLRAVSLMNLIRDLSAGCEERHQLGCQLMCCGYKQCYARFFSELRRSKLEAIMCTAALGNYWSFSN